MKKKNAAYIRISSLDKKKGYGKDIQIIEADTFASTINDPIDAYYIDESVSGMEERRDDLDRLLEACRAGKIRQ